MVSKGLVRRPDQGGRRCANGELALKFVVKVNVARVVRMLCKHTLVTNEYWVSRELAHS